MRLILGSQSPRRKEILGFFSYPFEQISSDFVEALVPFCGNPAAYAQSLAEGKALSLAQHYPDAVILTADTCVYKEGKLFEKPEDHEEAFAMLMELNGSWHTVYTAVTAQHGDKIISEYAETKVQFHNASHDQIMHYHNAFHGLDKAGGYGIQMAGSIIVQHMEGCFYNVMGLPISTTYQVLREIGIDLWQHLV